MPTTPIMVSVKAIYSACCGVASKAKELLKSKKANVSAHASLLFEYKNNEFAEVEATFDNAGSLKIEASPDILFEGVANDGESFVDAEKKSAEELCDKLGVCPKENAKALIEDYIQSMRS
jgi:hypothetical protein